MTKPYHGPCIGGPKDGTWFAHPAEGFQVATLPDDIIRRRMAMAEDDTTSIRSQIITRHYRYQSLPVTDGEDEIGVWIADDLDTTQAMIRLLANYSAPPRPA